MGVTIGGRTFKTANELPLAASVEAADRLVIRRAGTAFEVEVAQILTGLGNSATRHPLEKIAVSAGTRVLTATEALAENIALTAPLTGDLTLEFPDLAFTWHVSHLTARNGYAIFIKKADGELRQLRTLSANVYG